MSKGTPIMVKDGVEEVQVSPTFVCVSEDMQQSYWFSIGQGPYDLCVRTQNALAIHDEFLNVIYLCSAFLALPERPTGRNCPSIDTISNTFQGNNKTFFQYQTYVVVHELVHYYSEGQDLDLASDPPETYDWNACVALSAEASIRNPNNFKIYVAGPSEPTFYLGFNSDNILTAQPYSRAAQTFRSLQSQILQSPRHLVQA